MAAVTESTTEELDIHLFFPLYVSFAGTFNYMIVYLVGLTAAASVGAWTTMASVVLVGASMLWIPVVLLHLSLNLLGLNSTWFSVLLDYVFYFGAIATGAAFFGLAVEPFIMCALITPSIALFINIACFLFLDVPGYFFSSTVRYEHSSEQEISDSALEGVLERMLRRGPAAVNLSFRSNSLN
jgi:hypothetical protein